MGELTEKIDEIQEQLRALTEVVEQMSGRVEELCEPRRTELDEQGRDLLEMRRQAMAAPPKKKKEPESEEPVAEEEPDAMDVSPEELKKLRAHLDLTQQELAELIEVSPLTVSSWETGKSSPRQASRERIEAVGSMDSEEVDEALGREHVPAEMPPAEIKSIRERLDLIQAELAEQLGVSKGAITSWETGKSAPSRENRLALLELSRTSREEVDERLGRETPPLAGPEVSPDDIRSFREGLRLTQAELAERLGVSANTISNWEAGRSSPREGNLEKLRTLA